MPAHRSVGPPGPGLAVRNDPRVRATPHRPADTGRRFCRNCARRSLALVSQQLGYDCRRPASGLIVTGRARAPCTQRQGGVFRARQGFNSKRRQQPNFTPGETFGSVWAARGSWRVQELFSRLASDGHPHRAADGPEVLATPPSTRNRETPAGSRRRGFLAFGGEFKKRPPPQRGPSLGRKLQSRPCRRPRVADANGAGANVNLQVYETTRKGSVHSVTT
jgi:hypothetical protein